MGLLQCVCFILFNSNNVDYIISSARNSSFSLDSLTNEEVVDYSLLLKFSQKHLEDYYKCFSSTIYLCDNINPFHTHLIIREKDDKLGDNIYEKIKSFNSKEIEMEVNYDKSANCSEEVQNIQNFISHSRDIQTNF